MVWITKTQNGHKLPGKIQVRAWIGPQFRTAYPSKCSVKFYLPWCGLQQDMCWWSTEPQDGQIWRWVFRFKRQLSVNGGVLGPWSALKDNKRKGAQQNLNKSSKILFFTRGQKANTFQWLRTTSLSGLRKLKILDNNCNVKPRANPKTFHYLLTFQLYSTLIIRDLMNGELWDPETCWLLRHLVAKKFNLTGLFQGLWSSHPFPVLPI